MRPILAAVLLVFSTSAVRAQLQNALDFDGFDDQVTVPNGSGQLVGATAFSLSCWVYPRNSFPSYPDFDGFAGVRNELDAAFYLLQISPSTMLEGRFQNGDGTAVTVNFDGLQLNVWQHLALVYDGDALTIWYNGDPVSSVAADGVITNPNVPFHIGNVQFQALPFLLDGRVDEVALFTRALMAEEMDCLMSSGPSLTDQDLALYYRCDQGTPAGNNTSITTLTDLTGNIDGNLEGFALTGSSSNFVQGTIFGTTIEDVWCDGDTEYEFNGEILTGPGTYPATFTSSTGCDSTVILNLVQGEVNTSVVQNGNTLISTASGAIWQWVDCDNNNAPIPGATGQYYQATEVGNYAVIVTQGCTGMSACHSVTTIGITEHERPLGTLSPVPAREALNLELLAHAQRLETTIVDMTGREVLRHGFSNVRRAALDVSALGEGAYFLRIQADGHTNVLRFVKD